jgi:ribonuclease Z
MSSKRDYYFPNTEDLAPDEMRVTALGTGRPFVRRAQANTSWLIELGNGDKFVWDFGSGSQTNFTALEIPHQDITAYFATHLHADHVGDFAQVWIGSWAGGRSKPLIMYGPSGPEPKYGMKHFVQKQMESFAWDTDTRHGLLPDAGAEVEVHEFDFAKTGVIYENNGVVIKSFPAIHIYDGPVSFRLEWNGLCFVFSGDTTPSQFFVDNAKGADLLVHEAFNTVSQLMEVGHVFAQTQPRHAVIYHFFNDFDTAGEMERDVRQAWQGPLSLAQDLMVFNVTKDDILVRMAVTPDHVWPNKKEHSSFLSGSRKQRLQMSRWLADKQLFPKF